MSDSRAKMPSAAKPPPKERKSRSTMPDFYCGKSYHPEESIGYLMRRILNSIGQSVETCMAEPGSPTYPQWLPLYKVYMHSATTVAELARECSLDAGAMTRLLDRLEAKGLCRRVRSLSDRRVVHIELTDEGRAAAQEVPHVLSRIHNEHLAGFSRAEWEQLKSYLHRILANAQTRSGSGETKNEHSAS